MPVCTPTLSRPRFEHGGDLCRTLSPTILVLEKGGKQTGGNHGSAITDVGEVCGGSGSSGGR